MIRKILRMLYGTYGRTRNGAEFWTLNVDIAKRLAAFERKVLTRMFGGN